MLSPAIDLRTLLPARTGQVRRHGAGGRCAGVPGEEIPIPEGVRLPKGGKAFRGGSRMQMVIANVPPRVQPQLGGVELPDQLQREYDALQQRLARIAEDVS